MKKIIFLTFIVLMFTSGCENEDFFKLEKPVESPWQSVTEFERAPIGTYNALFARSDWNNNQQIWYLYKIAVADDVAWATPGDNAWGWYRDTQFNKKLLDDLFSWVYSAISSVNDAIQFVDEHDGNPYPNTSEDDVVYNLNRILGELYFLRGFSYYMVATVFCDAYVPGGANDAKQIPWRTKRASSYEEASNSKIGTTEEIWSQILSDFQKAFELLPERFIAGKMHPSYEAGRANKFAAAAMLMRSYFAMGNYPKAEEYASFVINQNGGDFNLSEDPIEAFNKSVLGRGREVIMYIPSYDETFGKRNYYNGTYNHMIFGIPNPWTATHMDYETLQRLGWMDNPKNDTTINLAAWRDKRFQQLYAIREPANVPQEERVEGRYYESRVNLQWRTILANKSSRGTKTDPDFVNLPLIRLAEIYLTRSICLFKANNKQGAADDLNVVKKRAWDAEVAGISFEESENFVTADNITEQMIGDERLIELFCEGDRIDYLRGLKAEVPDGDRGTGPVPYTDKGFVWPVPVKELDLNQGYN